MRYEIRVRFDDESSDKAKTGDFYQVLSKYEAAAMRHKRTRTSSILIRVEKPLDLKQLRRDLKDIEIISVRRTA